MLYKPSVSYSAKQRRSHALLEVTCFINGQQVWNGYIPSNAEFLKGAKFDFYLNIWSESGRLVTGYADDVRIGHLGQHVAEGTPSASPTITQLTGPIIFKKIEPQTVPLDIDLGTSGVYGIIPINEIISDFQFEAQIDWGDSDDLCEVSFRSSQNGYYRISFYPTNKISFRGTDTASEKWFVYEEKPAAFDPVSNKIVIIARGTKYSVFLNDAPRAIAEFEDGSFQEGMINLVAYSPSGRNSNDSPSCTFSDVWVWALDNGSAIIEPAPIAAPASLAATLQLLELKPEEGQLAGPEESLIQLDLDKDYGTGGRGGSKDLQKAIGSFVFRATIDWGDSDDHCQVYFHNNEKGAYNIGATPDGVVSFDKWNNGEFVFSKKSPPVSAKPDSNELVLFANDDQYQVYINGEPAFDTPIIDGTHARGGLSLVVWSPGGANVEGQPACTFRDVWVWELNKP